MSANDICLEVRNLKRYFKTPRGNVHAVDNINMQIKKGTTMGVVVGSPAAENPRWAAR